MICLYIQLMIQVEDDSTQFLWISSNVTGILYAWHDVFSELWMSNQWLPGG